MCECESAEYRDRREARRARLVMEQMEARLASAVPSVRKPLDGQGWQAGDMVWIAGLDGVRAAVIASATPRRLRLAMGSTRSAYESGLSPSDPSLCHSKVEALHVLERRSRP